MTESELFNVDLLMSIYEEKWDHLNEEDLFEEVHKIIVGGYFELTDVLRKHQTNVISKEMADGLYEKEVLRANEFVALFTYDRESIC